MALSSSLGCDALCAINATLAAGSGCTCTAQSSTSGNTNVSGTTNTPPGGASATDNTALYWGIGVVLVLAIIAIVVFGGKKAPAAKAA